MRKLVIGCGYLGRRVARQWRDQGHDVFALTRSKKTANEFRDEGLQPILGDVMQPVSLKFPAHVESCLYAIGLDRSAGFSQREVYVEGLQNVLSASTFDPTRLIYISSTSVYGQVAGEQIDENSPTEPARENGQVCLDAEHLIREQTHVPWSILRLSGIYGPGRLLARKEKLMNREPLVGNPDGWLNLIHVEDAVQAVMRCETHSKAVNETFLISDDRPILRREYYSLLAKQFGSPEPVFTGEATGLGKRCQNQKAREWVEFVPKYPSISEGLPASR